MQGHINTPSEACRHKQTASHWASPQEERERRGHKWLQKRDKGRCAAATKLNLLLLLPIDEFRLLKMHPHSWLSFVVLWQEKDNYLSQRQRLTCPFDFAMNAEAWWKAQGIIFVLCFSFMFKSIFYPGEYGNDNIVECIKPFYFYCKEE